MLESMLDKLKKEERTEADHNALQSLVHQRQICEKNLLSVRQKLADASKVIVRDLIESVRISYGPANHKFLIESNFISE